MKSTLTLLSLSLSLSNFAGAQLSIEPSWGSESFASVADRRFTSTSTNFNFAPSDGGAGSLSSATSLTESRGSSSGFSVLDASNGLSVPLIRTYASTNSGNWAAFGSSVAIEGYTFNGSAPKTFTLDASLTGLVSNIDNDFAGNFATLSIWSPSGEFFPPIATRTAGPDDGFFFSSSESSYLEFGFNQLDTLRLEQNGLNDDDVLSGSLSWTMEPGETVYLWASGRSAVYGPDSIADARNTLTASFQDSTGLSSLSGGVVPEPSTSLLGLLSLAVLFRRKR
ncbi:hypothetical protein [Roseibacillus persicicus]|uniref:PEP-CTERM protein-sorting domain-containing protein n=1 Tax=Roseibacillus persicicus TaxID=454148 RepID=A0A918TUX7_9BACT|nr:hypothetical protein [Roseibacillus persicicus]GHC63125.1 hypothetical protein GCM10007100_33230 [Roseibacillus persicicus]